MLNLFLQVFTGQRQVTPSKFSAEDITSDYRFLLQLVNTFPIDTDEYITQCVTK